VLEIEKDFTDYHLEGKHEHLWVFEGINFEVKLSRLLVEHLAEEVQDFLNFDEVLEVVLEVACAV
jgi:hypothetical protein